MASRVVQLLDDHLAGGGRVGGEPDCPALEVGLRYSERVGEGRGECGSWVDAAAVAERGEEVGVCTATLGLRWPGLVRGLSTGRRVRVDRPVVR